MTVSVQMMTLLTTTDTTITRAHYRRSVLAEAVFTEMLATSPLQTLVRADAASIGPSFDGGHDSRVMWAAQKAGLNLCRRNTQPFDEQADIVNYDLVLTMDHFDHEEVRLCLNCNIRTRNFPC